MSGHLSAEELESRLEAAREAGDTGTLEQVRRHRELAEACPAFAPNLLGLGRALQQAEPLAGEDTFDEAEQALRHAVRVTERSPAALVELAYFLSLVRGAPEQAETLLDEGARKALKLLEDAWAGRIQVLTELGRHEEARALGAVARRTFPDSLRIADADTSASTR
jgi:thioredoxin-like negative regulator of GroEL